VITLTLNPSLDRCLEVDGLAVGAVNRATRTLLDAGGKGVNVARGLHRHGRRVVAVFPVGGPDGLALVDELTAVGVPVHAVPIAGATRSNLTVADSRGVTTKINTPGPELSPEEVDAVVYAVAEELARGARTVVVAGSVPVGVTSAFARRLADLATEHGARLAVDTSGAALAEAVAHGGLDVVKPNEHELGELAGTPLGTVADVVAAARSVLARGTRAVLASLGPNGALLVTAEETWWAGGAPLRPVSTVGAGDATLAGWLAADGAAPGERLRVAVAWGRAAVLLPGTAMPAPEDLDLDAVRVVRGPDPALALGDLPGLASGAAAR
jgi:1-phosphofructokinase